MIIPLSSSSDRNLTLQDPQLHVRVGANLDFARAGMSFVRIEEGSVQLTCRDEVAYCLKTGEMALIRHAEITHVAAEDLRLIALSVLHDPGGNAVTIVAPESPSAPFPVPDAAMLVDGVVPKAFAAIALQRDGLVAGVWGSTPYHRKSTPFPRHEFMHLLEGAVTFETPLGDSFTFSAGDSFLVPCGFVADWKQTANVRKVFFMVQPDVPAA